MTRFRPRTSWSTLLAAAVTTAALAVTGCTAGGSAPSAPGTTASTTLRTAFQADMTTFDPDNGFEVAGLGAIRAVYEGLVDYEPGTTKVVGRLAEAYEVSDDGLTYTFTLRPGVKFHDGTAMTAAAVKAAFTRRKDGELLASYFLANVKSMATPDDATFVLTLSQPQPSLLDNLASAWGPKVVSPEGLKQVTTDKGWLDEHASGTGPFTLASFERGQRYVLERFGDYWGTPAAMEKVEIAIVPDVGQQVLQLRNSELDVVLHGYPYAQLGTLPQGLTATGYDDLGLEMAFVNPTRTLKTAAQRRQVIAALDPKGWLVDAFGDRAQPAQSLYPRAMLTPATPYAWPTADPGAAPIPALEIAYTAEEAGVQQRVADLLIAQLGAAGIEATARAVPGTQVAAFAKNPAKAPDLLLAQNNPDSAHPESHAGLFFATGAPLNIYGYSNAEADKAFTAAAELTDVDQRNAAYAAAGQTVFSDGGFVPLADVQDVIVHRNGLSELGTRPAVPWNLDFGTVRWAG